MKEKFDNSVLISRITFMCDVMGTSVNKMLLESGAGASTVDNMKKGSVPTVDKLVKIADRLETSTDYLLGRSNNPQLNDSTYINGDNNNNGNQAINGNININTGTTEKDDRQLLEMIKSLDIVQRAKIITAIDEIKKNNT